jgi:hypothetical protein
MSVDVADSGASDRRTTYPLPAGLIFSAFRHYAHANIVLRCVSTGKTDASRRSIDGVSVCYQDAWETARPTDPGLTFTAENPLVRAGEVATAVSRRIDYVLVRAGRHGALLQVMHCERLLDGPVDSVWASDHYGVIANLSVPEHPPGTWTSGSELRDVVRPPR